MYRYIALMWNRTDREAAAAARFIETKLPEVSTHQWSRAWDGPGLAVYHAGEQKGRMQTYRLQGERGAVLGRLFRNDYSSVVDDLDEFESRKCLETRGQHLIDNYWGRYTAFLNDPSSGTRYVMRDPTGAFPCFLTSFGGVTIYFSDMQDVANFDFLPFTVNWDFVKAEIILPQFQKTITGLNEVREVLPAECLEVTLFETKSRFVWNPTEISQSDVVEDLEVAAALLRESVMNTIGALAGCYDSVIHNLGGLDSSIVLACLAQAPKRPEITCLNFYTRSPRGEERFYCRQVAKMYDIELVERELDYRKAPLSKMLKSNKRANPVGALDGTMLTGDLLDLAKERQAQTLIYGRGGDQVFFQGPRNFGALDYVHRHGLFGRNAPRVALEASRYGRISLFSTLKDMALERIAPVPCSKHFQSVIFGNPDTFLLNRDYLRESSQVHLLHPLLIPEDLKMKGKYKHIFFSALYATDYYDPHDTDYCVDRTFVYFMQPIIETCLRIPTWVLTYGGVERGLARKVFRYDLPPDIVRRFSKSTPQAYYDDLFAHNKKFVRDILLDGVLTSEAVLLRDKVEEALTGHDPFLQVVSHDIIDYLETEIWLRSWMERPAPRLESMELAV